MIEPRRPRFIGEPERPDEAEMRFLESMRRTLLKLYALATVDRPDMKYTIEMKIVPNTRKE